MWKSAIRTWTRSEIVTVSAALVSFLSSLITIATGAVGEQRALVQMILVGVPAGFAVWWIVLITRSSYTIRGYREVMRFVQRLAETADFQVWTVRTHLGTAEFEYRYFDVLVERVREGARPLQDFRRLVRLSPNTLEHAKWLLSQLHGCGVVQVRGFRGGGPQMDFMLVDGAIAVVAFPMEGGGGHYSAMVIRRRAIVQGIIAVFNVLWGESEVLFTGHGTNTLDRAKDAERRIDRMIEGLTRGVPPEDRQRVMPFKVVGPPGEVAPASPDDSPPPDPGPDAGAPDGEGPTGPDGGGLP